MDSFLYRLGDRDALIGIAERALGTGLTVEVGGEKLRHRLDDVPLEPVVSIAERVQA
jgi:hypothetical protein